MSGLPSRLPARSANINWMSTTESVELLEDLQLTLTHDRTMPQSMQNKVRRPCSCSLPAEEAVRYVGHVQTHGSPIVRLLRRWM